MEEKKTIEYRLARLLDEYFEIKKDGGYLAIENIIQQELDRAREEGKREALEQIQRFVEDEMLVITRDGTDILEKYIKEWLSKLN